MKVTDRHRTERTDKRNRYILQIMWF